MTALSIFEAAKEHPDRLAIVGAEGTFTYGALANRVRAIDPPEEIVGRTDVATIASLLAAFERRRPVHLLHPRWGAAEVGRVRASRRIAPPPETLAVFATSGSTGRPKLVALSRSAFLAATEASAANLGWRENDRWQLTIPLAHVGGFSILVRTLVARRTIVLGGRVGDHGATIVSLVPTQLARLLDSDREYAAIRAMLIGGAPTPWRLRQAAGARGWPVLTTYGSTETCAQVATERPGAPVTPGVGPPLAGVEVQIVDGSIQVRGPSIAPTYLSGDAALDANGWFDTGDLGRLDDGRLFVTGRRDDVIITGGENVMPFEVEEAMRRIPGVDDAVVFARADDTWGQVVVAAVVARAVPDPSAFDLAGFKRPRRIARFDEFPRLSSSKIDRRRVAAMADLKDWGVGS